jgi:hypothetical protein
MGSHVYRSFAVEEARKSGWVGFGTSKTREDMWKAHYERGDNPADLVASLNPTYFTHGEVSWMAGRTDDDGPVRIGLLVARCSFDQLAQLGAVEVDRVYARVFLTMTGTDTPMLVQPKSGARWPIFTPTPEGSKPAAEAPAKPPGDRVETPRRTATSATAPIRSRSEGDSPVKRVWAMAESMPGASRSEVVAACVAAGINKNTAGTQYFHWKKSKSATA